MPNTASSPPPLISEQPVVLFVVIFLPARLVFLVEYYSVTRVSVLYSLLE